MARSIRVAGHSLVAEGAPFDSELRRINSFHGSGGQGRAQCSCGELSQPLSSARARKDWHRSHKAVMAEGKTAGLGIELRMEMEQIAREEFPIVSYQPSGDNYHKPISEYEREAVMQFIESLVGYHNQGPLVEFVLKQRGAKK